MRYRPPVTASHPAPRNRSIWPKRQNRRLSSPFPRPTNEIILPAYAQSSIKRFRCNALFRPFQHIPQTPPPSILPRNGYIFGYTVRIQHPSFAPSKHIFFTEIVNLPQIRVSRPATNRLAQANRKHNEKTDRWFGRFSPLILFFSPIPFAPVVPPRAIGQMTYSPGHSSFSALFASHFFTSTSTCGTSSIIRSIGA